MLKKFRRILIITLLCLIFPLQSYAQESHEKALRQAEMLDQQAGEAYQQGRFSDAIPLAQQVLAIREKALDSDHFDIAVSLNVLATLYRETGRFQEALPLYQRALTICERSLDPDHAFTGANLNNLALLYKEMGRYEDALPLQQRALTIFERTFDPENPHIATALNNLGLLYKMMGRYEEALPLYQRALAIREKVLDPYHFYIATSLDNLAVLYEVMGKYEEALPLYQRALAIKEQSLDPDHSSIATTLHNIAGLYEAIGSYEEALPLLQRSIAISEKSLGLYHPETASSLNSLAKLYYSMERYEEALPLYQRVLTICEKSLDPDHPFTAMSFNNFAALYHSMGRHEEALLLYQGALAIREKSLGPDHPETASSFNNLAILYENMKLYEEALPLYQRALAIAEKSLGFDHPDTAKTLKGIAIFYLSVGMVKESMLWTNRVLESEEKILERLLTTPQTSEKQKRAYLNTLKASTDYTISLHQQSLSEDLDAQKLAIQTILRRKGRLLDAQAQTLRSIRRLTDPTARELLVVWQKKLSEISALTLRGPEPKASERFIEKRQTLESEIEQLERDLATKSEAFRIQQAPVTTEAVAALLPSDAVLVELVTYQPFNPRETEGKRWGKARYAAYSLTSDGTIQSIDLGEADRIDRLAYGLLQCLKTPGPCGLEGEWQGRSKALYEILWQPMLPLLNNRPRVLLAADGALNLVPFEVLIDAQGVTLLESTEITYLTSGRDLIRAQLKMEPREPPSVVALPDYTQGENSAAWLQSDTLTSKLASLQGGESQPQQTSETLLAVARKGPDARFADLAEVNWPPLSGTLSEARLLAEILPGRLRGALQSDATEALLRGLQGPEILHLATHGFFLADRPAPMSESDRGIGMAMRMDAPTPKAGKVGDSLQRSGLVLAGANGLKGDGVHDGLLTAQEVAGLDLEGTKLVVLSACETAVGDAAAGEGVYGLRRALVLAGAESQVLSLWKVSDEGTATLMRDYYERLLAGQGRTDALRQARLAMFGSSKWSHPYYWAAFVTSGNWRSLDGQESQVTPYDGNKRLMGYVEPSSRGCACQSMKSKSIPQYNGYLLLLFVSSLFWYIRRRSNLLEKPHV